MEPSSPPATYEDLLDLPEYLVGEIIAGRLVTHRRPPPKQAAAYSALGCILGLPFDAGRGGPGGWWIIDAPELHLDADILVPDVAGWQHQRMPRLPEARFELAPDWVCEILSPATARVDRAGKLPIYARHGVRHTWLVDPDLRTLEVFENRDGMWLLLTVLENDDAVSQPPSTPSPSVCPGCGRSSPVRLITPPPANTPHPHTPSSADR